MDSFEKLLRSGLRTAVRHYWLTRTRQMDGQRTQGKVRDQGRRAEVTGGKQLDGFPWLLRDILATSAVPGPDVFSGQADTYLPGYFRPT